MSWLVYILECSDGSLYTGVTNNIDRRLKQHNEGKGAKYTRVRRPLVLRFTEDIGDKSLAHKREYQIKQLTRKQKLNLINQ
jgi:putative endonuclease